MKRRIVRVTLVIATVFAVLLGSFSTTLAAEQQDPSRPTPSSRSVRGEVLAIGERALAIRTTRGLGLVVMNEDTILRIPDMDDPTLDDLSIGDQIVALGRGRGHLFGARVVAVETDAELTRVAGQVTAVEGSTVTLNTRSEEGVSVFTDPDTIFYMPDLEEPGVEDIEVGMLIEVAGFLDGEDLQAILVACRQGERRARLMGQVSSVEDSSLSLEIRDSRRITLSVDAETAFHVTDVEDASLADVPVGARAIVEIEAQGGVPRALTVVVWPEEPARVGGTVIEIEGKTLRLETEQGEVEAITGMATLVRIPDVEAPSLDDIQPGDRALCAGSWEDESTFSALVVVARKATADAR